MIIGGAKKGEVSDETLTSYIAENVKQQSIVINKKSQTPQVNVSEQFQNSWQTIKLK